MTRYGGMGRTRPKKLTSKASIPIVREDEIDLIDDEIQNALQQIETGVEKAEESEFHLQVAINAAAQGKVKDAHIPTPETLLSNLRYDELYPPIFSQPATYIRFSATVEDCCGPPYCMDEEDDVFLKIFNQKRDANGRCTEDQFEEVMSFFELTSRKEQPYACVDNSLMSFDDFQQAMDPAVEDSVKRFAKDIYDHWKSRRANSESEPLLPSPKVEAGRDTDDTDPYVCFRRREVRQTRKTRGRDAQSADKLRRLRKELEDARQMVALVRQRELARKEMLSIERQVFMQRSEVKEMKRKLNIKDDDEDLINQKPKKKPVEAPAVQRPAPPQLRMPPKTSSTQAAEDLQLLEDVQAEKENEIVLDIKQNITKHIKWNEGYVDFTRAPLSPSPERMFDAAFRPAITTQLPTPPSSENSDSMLDSTLDTTSAIALRDKLAPHAMELSEDTSKMPSFRRRIGRGGRLWIDRRNLASRCRVDMDAWKADRFKFDQEDSDDEIEYCRDPFDIQIMQHRAIMAAKARDQAAAAQAAAAQAHAQAQAQAAQAQAQAQAQRRLQEQTAANNSPSGGQPMGSNPGPGAVASASET
ncbi:enhancer of polycomb-like protein 1 [Aspergillus heteromorphus CBS 117.55]|uniref:Enhancer of polycomb-like protein n=1 Tax=Aspergillus heteromorphus CBS 117.55 TaxID=1448321 RepID=A0A317WFG5_9EURO|nr:enhancer of polycomb-like protein 1 [Aspergillus heteromorphus CBS 117.55]PWY82990.1 enhancer of polycomb-like protein 1 [Aspergillus heteromorphus CBS 117.55]